MQEYTGNVEAMKRSLSSLFRKKEIADEATLNRKEAEMALDQMENICALHVRTSAFPDTDVRVLHAQTSAFPDGNVRTSMQGTSHPKVRNLCEI